MATLAVILPLMLLLAGVNCLLEAFYDAAQAVRGRGPSMRQMRQAAHKLAAAGAFMTDQDGDEDVEVELVLIHIPTRAVGLALRPIAAWWSFGAASGSGCSSELA